MPLIRFGLLRELAARVHDLRARILDRRVPAGAGHRSDRLDARFAVGRRRDRPGRRAVAHQHRARSPSAWPSRCASECASMNKPGEPARRRESASAVRRQSDPEGRLDDAATRARSSRSSARPAAARRRCCARSPGSEQPSRGQDRDRRRRCSSTAPPASTCRSRSATSASCSSPTRCGRIARVFENVAVRPALARRTGRRGRRARQRRRSTNLGLGALAQRAAASAFGRPAAARRDRARARLQPAGRADGRAAVQPRREAARGSARAGCAS